MARGGPMVGKIGWTHKARRYRNHPNPAFQNERVRGTGGFDVTSFGEENLLNLPLDRYDDESIAVHEFCHTIDAALRRIDPAWRERLAQTHRGAIARGLWKNAYTATNPAEYWAELCQSYFDCNRVNNWNHGPVGTREQLKLYDPEGYELRVTEIAVADEIAAAAELVMGKLDRCPVAIVRGLSFEDSDETAQEYVRPAARDMFR